jgi:hypothetical protein
MNEALVRSKTLWRVGERPRPLEDSWVRSEGEICWLDLVGEPKAAPELFELLKPLCPGLDLEKLEDLLTPDDQPSGCSYDEGGIKLASTFSVRAERLTAKSERGKAQGAGVLVFEPVELLAGDGWLLTCWHPTRTFAGAEQVVEGPPESSADALAAASKAWPASNGKIAGDLGVLVMEELALTYNAANWELKRWLEDWELSLYVDDELDNPDELPQLWGSMAVLRDWLTPLNRPGLRAHLDRAWLPATDHKRVMAVDDRVDRALDNLSDLSHTMRASFSVLHVQLAEEERARKETTQHRVELFAAVFLVPTLVVGFYGANTWVPGQGQHWGFWVMLAALFLLSALAVAMVVRWQRAATEAAQRLELERQRVRDEMIGNLRDRHEKRRLAA